MAKIEIEVVRGPDTEDETWTDFLRVAQRAGTREPALTIRLALPGGEAVEYFEWRGGSNHRMYRTEFWITSDVLKGRLSLDLVLGGEAVASVELPLATPQDLEVAASAIW